MSRLAKKPISLASGVTCTIQASTLQFQWAKGTLTVPLPSTVQATLDGQILTLTNSALEKKDFAQWGLTWSLVQNSMKGVTEWFKKVLEIQWVGYRYEIQGKNLVLAVGFSHKVTLPIPHDVVVEAHPEIANALVISGIDAQHVGQFASKIRAVKPPEPYKGKGIRYSDEFVRRKAGKTGSK